MARKVLRKDWASYTDGDFTLVNNPWNPGKLANGADYTQSITFNTDDISRNVRFKWDWPDVGHVVAYPEIIAGYKPWGGEGSDALVTRLDRLREMEVTFDYAISGDKADFNVAFDLWLTGSPLSDSSDITTEVMIWTHEGDFQPAGEKVGFYRDGNFRAQIWVADDFGDSSGGERRHLALHRLAIEPRVAKGHDRHRRNSRRSRQTGPDRRNRLFQRI
ncbi:MAG: hypothetical protein KL863_14980 [Rhizobium sp.]|nr:hypothetical protein [Rhizobium sp.]